MEEGKKETDPKAKLTSSFLGLVKGAVETNTPVFINTDKARTLNPNLAKIAFSLQGPLAKMAGINITNEEIIALAEAGESAAKLEIARRRNADSQQIASLQEQRKDNFAKLQTNNKDLASKYGLSQEEMLGIFQALTK